MQHFAAFTSLFSSFKKTRREKKNWFGFGFNVILSRMKILALNLLGIYPLASGIFIKP